MGLTENQTEHSLHRLVQSALQLSSPHEIAKSSNGSFEAHNLATDIPASVQSDDGRLLTQDFHAKIRTSGRCHIFTAMRLLFYDSDSHFRGELSFNYASFASASINGISQIEFRQSTGAQRYGDSTASIGECYRLILDYNFDTVAIYRLGSNPRFASLIEHLKSSKTIVILLKMNSLSANDIKKKIARIDEEKSQNPTRKYFRASRPCYEMDAMTNLSQIRQDHGSLLLCWIFHNRYHYLFTIAAAIQIDHDLVKQKAENYANRDHKMLIAEVEEGNTSHYRIFLQAPNHQDSKIKPGDQIRVLFSGRKDWSEAWAITVAPFAPDVNKTLIEGRMSRPWKKIEGQPTKKAYDSYRINAIPAARFKPSLDVMKDRGVRVKVRLDIREALVARRFKCLMQMALDNNAHAPSNPISKVLVANNLSDIKCSDVFLSISEEYGGDPEALMVSDLNEGQKMAVRMCRSAPAGVALVQGPPGTGKTFLIVNIMTPYILSKELRRVLVTSQTNHATNQLAYRCHKSIEALRKKHPEQIRLLEKFVVRVFPNEIEEGLKRQKERAQQSHGKIASIPKPPDDLSLFCVMLQFAGVYDDGPKAVDPGQFKDFRTQYHEFMKNKTQSTLDLECFMDLVEDLRDHVLQRATIVCTTVTTAGSKVIHRNLRDQTDLIIADEMPRCSEADTLLLLMGDFKQCGFIGVGDPDQLGPFVESSEDTNPFFKQLSTSLQERLQHAGFPHAFLSVQHRMSPELSRDTSDIMYQSRLQDHESVKHRALTDQVRQFNKRKYSKTASKLMLNMTEFGERESSKTKQLVNNSRCNEEHVMYCMNLATELTLKFPEVSIGILTGYESQFGLYVKAKEKMRRNVPCSNVHIHKIDTVQGLEFDIVVLDLLFLKRHEPGSGSIGFLRDDKRLNVATSRAKHGMYIVVDEEAWSDCPTGREHYQRMREFMERWRENAVDVKADKPLRLACQHYEAGAGPSSARDDEDEKC